MIRHDRDIIETRAVPAQTASSVAGIVLAGGHMWSAAGRDSSLPKPLLPVLNVPLIVHILRWYAGAGIRNVTVCLNAYARRIRHYLGDGRGLGLDLHYVEDRLPRGPAGCLFDASRFVDADRFVVMEANSIPLVDFDALSAWHAARNAGATVVVRSRANPAGVGERTVEPIGMYVFERDALEPISRRGYEDIKEGLIPRLHKRDRNVSVYETDRAAPRVYGLNSYLALNGWALRAAINSDSIPASYHLIDGALVEHSAVTEPGVRIIGPCLIAEGAHVQGGALLIGPTILGRHCSVGRNSIVSQSVFWDFASIESERHIDHAIRTLNGRSAAAPAKSRTLNRPVSAVAATETIAT